VHIPSEHLAPFATFPTHDPVWVGREGVGPSFPKVAGQMACAEAPPRLAVLSAVRVAEVVDRLEIQPVRPIELVESLAARAPVAVSFPGK
jgi:hypothetical protein